jgi:hypothetical protein
MIQFQFCKLTIQKSIHTTTKNHQHVFPTPNTKHNPIYITNPQRHQNQHHPRRTWTSLQSPEDRHVHQRAKIGLVHHHQSQRPNPRIDRHSLRRKRDNVIVREADQYGKRITPARYFRVIIEILRDALSFLLIMPTYSEEDLTNALAAYRNREFTSIRKCAYAFNIPYSTLASRLSTRTSRS